MNEIILNTNFPSKRSRLTREELLAGKCFPGDPHDASLDPRLRSPDEFLSQKSTRPTSSASISTESTSIESPSETCIRGLQKRYENEIAAWMVYEKQVMEWKKNVSAIIEQHKGAAQQRDQMAEELQKTFLKLKQQEQELTWLRQQLLAPTSTPL